MLLNSSQSAVAIYRYDPYGNTMTSSGTLAGANLQWFSSKTALDVPSMALYYYGERFYAPDLQRWINRDPIGELGHETLRRGIAASADYAQNLFSFCLNSPVQHFDPDGRVVPAIPAVIIVGGMGIGHVAALGYLCWTLDRGEEALVRTPLTMGASLLSGIGAAIPQIITDGPAIFMLHVWKDDCGDCHSEWIAVPVGGSAAGDNPGVI